MDALQFICILFGIIGMVVDVGLVIVVSGMQHSIEKINARLERGADRIDRIARAVEWHHGQDTHKSIREDL